MIKDINIMTYSFKLSKELVRIGVDIEEYEQDFRGAKSKASN